MGREKEQLESLPIQFSQREDHGLEPMERKMVGSLPRKGMAPRDDNHSPASYTNRSKVVQEFLQMVVHLPTHESLNIQCLGLRFTVIVFIVVWGELWD